MFGRILSALIDKKRIVGWVSALAMVALAAAAGMKTDEFKEAVCGAPVLTESK